MPKYLFKAQLSVKGLEGTMQDGGTGRRRALTDALEAMGGSLESFYYAFGGTDVYLVADLPDNVTAAATAITVALSGTGSVETVVLIEPEEFDAVANMTVDYRPPGG